MTKIWVIITLSLLATAFSVARAAYRALLRLSECADNNGD